MDWCATHQSNRNIHDIYHELKIHLDQLDDEIERIAQLCEPIATVTKDTVDGVSEWPRNIVEIEQRENAWCNCHPANVDDWLPIDNALTNPTGKRLKVEESDEFEEPSRFELLELDALIAELTGSCSTLENSEQFAADMGTQTSSMSRSSMNLTSLSDLSSTSSPSLATASSEPDVFEDRISLAEAGDERRKRRTGSYRRPWQRDLCTKSSSAPVLKKVSSDKVSKQIRSQSDRHLAAANYQDQISITLSEDELSAMIVSSVVRAVGPLQAEITDLRQRLDSRDAPRAAAYTRTASPVPVCCGSVAVSEKTGKLSWLTEIEAAEVCEWLRAAGFPQYAQVYEEMQCPIDIAAAERDHAFLDPTQLDALFRRLNILNRCAAVRQHQQPKSPDDDSEDECALSDSWTYQSDLKRWSRHCSTLFPSCSGTANAIDKGLPNQPARSPNRSRSISASSSTSETSKPSSPLPRPSTAERCDNVAPKRSPFKRDLFHSINWKSTKNQRQRARSLDKTDQLASCAGYIDSPFFRARWRRSDEEYISTISVDEEGIPIANLSCNQLLVVRSYALLKLTALMEKYCPSHRSGWNWELPKFIRKIKSRAYRDKNVFGVPLTITLQRSGHPLPTIIQSTFDWLQQNAWDQVGLFRKPGVKSRIESLKAMVEDVGDADYTEQQAYNVADMVKQYFRDLPEALLTNKLSKTFLLIFQHVPPPHQREAVVCALLLMPDEHREVLQYLLNFLRNIAEHSDANQMTASNLAVCFAPSLFHAPQTHARATATTAQHTHNLDENRAAHECIYYLLTHMTAAFIVPRDFLTQCKIGQSDAVVALAELGSSLKQGWRGYLNECQAALLREMRERGRGWRMCHTEHAPLVEVSSKKVADGCPLRLWRVVVLVEAPPTEIVHRILRDRHLWDNDLQSAKIVAQLDQCTEVFHYARKNLPPLPVNDYCVVRCWRGDLAKGACTIVETSVEHADAPALPNTVRGNVLASRYLIEPCGLGRSRVQHMVRIDCRGRKPDWYQKHFGHVCAIQAAQLQFSFQKNASGRESHV